MKLGTNVLTQVVSVSTLLSGLMLATACSSNQSSFSLLPTGQTFQQSNSSTSNKVDLLWVIDNSPSMTPNQTNLTNNINAFMTNFQSKNLDFKLAVTTTEAYLAGTSFDNDNTYSKFRDGVGATHTGIFVIVPGTANLINMFVTNASQGQAGSGDERAFSSMRTALNDPQNAGFHRSDAFLAVIILSDEDDFSGDGRVEGSWVAPTTDVRYVPDHDYTPAVDSHAHVNTLDTVDSYVSFLDTFTQSTGTTKHYNVSSIAVLDSACASAQHAANSNSIIGQRYIDLATATSGSVGSLCDTDFAATLTKIQENILELSSQFFLSRTPVVSSIVVVVNSVTIAQDDSNGWSYNADNNSIVFHGASIPPESASIAINFDPTTIK